MGMRRIRVEKMGMQGIRVGMLGIRMGIREIGVGMWGIAVAVWRVGTRNEGNQGENLRIGVELMN